MFGFKVDQAKGMFFDRQKVEKAEDRAALRALSKFGAFVRTRARSSLRKRKAASQPGQPPSSHLGYLKQFLYFVYDAVRRSVIIGPAKLNAKIGNAPEALEHGGESLILRRARGAQKIAAKMERIHIRARPFMEPALEAESPQLPRLTRDSIRP